MDNEAPTKELQSLRNLGPACARWLLEIGVQSRADLETMGALEAFCRIEERHPRKVNIVLLWALWGALNDVDWRDITPETKAQLKAELASDAE
jgi:DNA transformation protein and related proteins